VDRNTALAFALSLMVFVLFLMYQERQYENAALEAQSPTAEIGAPGSGETGEPAVREGERRAPQVAQSPSSPGGSPALAPPQPEPAPIAEETRNIPISEVILENENVVAKISNGPALIRSWRLKGYDEKLPTGEVPIELVESEEPILKTEVAGVPGASFVNAHFEVISKTNREVVQRARGAAGVLTRTIRIDDNGYGFELDLAFESHRTDPVEARFEVIWPAAVSDRPDFRQLSLIAYGPEQGVTRTLVASVGQAGFFGRLFGKSSDGTVDVEGPVRWAGIDIRYFTGVVIGDDPAGSLAVEFESVEKGKSGEARISPPGVMVGSGGSAKQTLKGFIGPKAEQALAAADAGLEHSINRGWSWLEPLTRLFEIALDKLYGIIPNYGLAIIVLTILVRLIVSPLMVKQMRSAEKMRTIQPRVKALQEKYKDDRQKQSEEMMKLWREEGVNPLGGCLPVLFQFPVLIGLFYALQSSIGLRHAPFVGWITDLSQPATLFTIPGLDFPVRLLPLIMGASMFVQQKMTPTTGMDPAQARMMQIMMPGMMLLISYTFPSGLVLYWTVSNLLGIGHQYWIRNKMQTASG
jgi:YidC/Oxa1 family membrane protein insertase